MSRRMVLYSRQDCHLCEEMLAALKPLVAGKLEVDVVDVDQDVVLRQRYGLRIPVLFGDAGELSGYPLDVARVRDYLKS